MSNLAVGEELKRKDNKFRSVRHFTNLVRDDENFDETMISPSNTSVFCPQLDGGLRSESLQVLGGHREDVVGVSLETVQ